MPVNYSIPNMTHLTDMGDYVNSVTNNVFGIGVMVVIAVLVFATLHRFYGLRVSTGSTAVIVGILAIVWRFTGLISDFVMYSCIMLGFAGILYLYLSKE